MSGTDALARRRQKDDGEEVKQLVIVFFPTRLYECDFGKVNDNISPILCMIEGPPPLPHSDLLLSLVFSISPRIRLLNLDHIIRPRMLP